MCKIDNLTTNKQSSCNDGTKHKERKKRRRKKAHDRTAISRWFVRFVGFFPQEWERTAGSGVRRQSLKQICLIACFTDLSANDRRETVQRGLPSDELLRPRQFHFAPHREGNHQHSTQAITTDASVFEVNYNHYEFELSMWLMGLIFPVR